MAATCSRIDTWAVDCGWDLRWRSRRIDEGQRIAYCPAFSLGAIDPVIVARFAASAVFAPATRESSYRIWLVDSEPQIAAAELRRLQEHIDTWPGSDNDPILDDLIRQRQQWQDALGISLESLLDVAAAMQRGETPDEAELPQHLFPPAYVSDIAQYTERRERISHLADEYQGIVDGLLQAHWGSEEFRELTSALHQTKDELDSARGDLTRPAWSTTEARSYLVSTPLLDYRANHQAAGMFLATGVRASSDSLDELTTVAELLTEGSTLEAQAFFNELGPAGTAALPGALASAAGFAEPNGPAHQALRRFSAALAAASHRGLAFGGAELFPPFDTDGPAPNLMEANPAVLFLYGRFEADFMIGAAVRPLEDPLAFQSILDAGLFGMTLVASIDDVANGELFDMRVILLSRVAELGPEAAAHFVAAAICRGVLDELIRPNYAYADGGAGAGGIIALVGQDVAAARNIVSAIGADAKPLPAGVAVGAENMFLSHITALVQSNSTDAMMTPISPLSGLEPATLDTFLRSLFSSGAGDKVAREVDETIAFEVAMAADHDLRNARSIIDRCNDELGQMVGRVEAAEFLAAEELAKNRDNVNSARATISGILLDAGISLVPIGRLAAITWNTAAQVGTGMAADIGAGALTERLYPTDAAESLYRAKIHDVAEDVDQGTRITIELLAGMGLIDRADVPDNDWELNEWLDNTYVIGSGDTVGEWVTTVRSIYVEALLVFDDEVFD